jgi:hypothetical protein
MLTDNNMLTVTCIVIILLSGGISLGIQDAIKQRTTTDNFINETCNSLGYSDIARDNTDYYCTNTNMTGVLIVCKTTRSQTKSMYTEPCALIK